MAIDAARDAVYVLVDNTFPGTYVGSWGAYPNLSTIGLFEMEVLSIFALQASDGSPLWSAVPQNTVDDDNILSLWVTPTGRLLVAGMYDDWTWYTDPLNAAPFSTPALNLTLYDGRTGVIMQIQVKGHYADSVKGTITD